MAKAKTEHQLLQEQHRACKRALKALNCDVITKSAAKRYGSRKARKEKRYGTF